MGAHSLNACPIRSKRRRSSQPRNPHGHAQTSSWLFTGFPSLLNDSLLTLGAIVRKDQHVGDAASIPEKSRVLHSREQQTPRNSKMRLLATLNDEKCKSTLVARCPVLDGSRLHTCIYPLHLIHTPETPLKRHQCFLICCCFKGKNSQEKKNGKEVLMAFWKLVSS